MHKSIRCIKVRVSIMGDISKHFSRKEHACECGCGFAAVDHELNMVLEDFREHFGRIEISGPNRCVKHNATIRNAATHSYHTKGMATDNKFLDLPTIRPKAVYDYACLKYEGKYGFILYHNRMHVDVRPGSPYREIKA